MKYLLIALTVLVSGCSTTVPVTMKFPEKPADVDACPQLKKLDDSAKLSDVSTTLNNNYTTYYECSVKNDTWNEWYQTQKRIFEKVK